MNSSYDVDAYDDSEFDAFDRTRFEGGVTIFQQIFSKTSLLAEYVYGVINYDSSTNDSIYNQAEVGIKGDLSSKMTVYIKGGVQTRDYEKDTLDDIDAVVASADIEHRCSSKLKVNLNAGYDVTESFYKTNSYYESFSSSLKITKKIFAKLTSILNVVYDLNQYPEVTTEGTQSDERQDSLIGGEVSFLYELTDWLTAGAQYYLRDRDSNLDVFD